MDAIGLCPSVFPGRSVGEISIEDSGVAVILTLSNEPVTIEHKGGK